MKRATDYPIDAVTKLHAELCAQYPSEKAHFDMALKCENYEIHGLNPWLKNLFMDAPKMLEQHCTRIDDNMDFESQIKI